MESLTNSAPTITDSVEMVCKHCKTVAYQESVKSQRQEDGTTDYSRTVSGTFRQKCDVDGLPFGPVIPVCKCREEK
jgi:hypothetical protein